MTGELSSISPTVYSRSLSVLPLLYSLYSSFYTNKHTGSADVTGPSLIQLYACFSTVSCFTKMKWRAGYRGMKERMEGGVSNAFIAYHFLSLPSLYLLLEEKTERRRVWIRLIFKQHSAQLPAIV